MDVFSPQRLSALKLSVLLIAFAGCNSTDTLDVTRIPKYVEAISNTELYIEASESISKVIDVRVLASDSLPISDVSVFFSVIEGKATLTESMMNTGEEGIASIIINPDPIIQTVRLKAEVPELEGSPLFFDLFIRATIPAVIEIESGNFQDALVNSNLNSPLNVLIEDRFGNVVQGVEVLYAVSAGDGELTSQKVVTNELGIASTEFKTGNEAVHEISARINDQQVSFVAYSLYPVQQNKVASYSNYSIVHWNKSSHPLFNNYQVLRRSRNASSWSTIAFVSDVNTLSFKDEGVRIGEHYEYTVYVTSTTGISAASTIQNTVAGHSFNLRSDIHAFDVLLSADESTWYIANANENRILMVSSETLEKTDSIMLDFAPYQLELSNDETKMYATVYGEGEFSIIDMETGSVTATIDVSEILGETVAIDIWETNDGQLFVSGYSGYIVSIDTQNNFTTKRVADGESFHAGYPRFLGEYGDFLYVQEGNLSANKLLKLSLSSPNVSIVQEDDGQFIGMRHAVLSSDGAYVYTTSGQIINTEDFSVDGVIPGILYGIQSTQISNRLIGCFYGGSFTDTAVLKVFNSSTMATEFDIPLAFTSARIFVSKDEKHVWLISDQEYPYYQYRLFKIPIAD